MKRAERGGAALFGDSIYRAYAPKLELFNRFAEPELRVVLAGLGLNRGERVLDAGCGAGLMTGWISELLGPKGIAIGLDLAASHVQQTRHNAQANAWPLRVVQGDMNCLPFRSEAFDWVWCSNAIGHLREPVTCLRALARALRPNGRLVLGQSAFLPDMFFAWDARLEKEVMLACRRYYRDKYDLEERDTTQARNLFAWLAQAGLTDLTVQTHIIERVAPLTPTDEQYFLSAVFQGYWDHRVRPYLTQADWSELVRLCSPESPDYCLRRPDFHHIQTFTVVSGQCGAV